jgi:hypothetical protein
MNGYRNPHYRLTDMADAPNFRRIVLGIRHSAPRHGLRQATEIAAMLQAELRGLFIEGDELTSLAALPFAREFRQLEGGWRALDREDLTRAFNATARSAERLFSDAVKGRNLSCEFEVVRGRITEAIGSESRSGDILIVPEPANPTERITFQFESMIKAAFGSSAAVMLVPEAVARETGPVVAIAHDPHDASIDAASTIAAVAKERLLIIDPVQFVASFLAGMKLGTEPPTKSVGRGQHLLPADIEAALQPLRERLVVLTRGLFDVTVPATIASARRVPVLIVEPRSRRE